MSGKSFLIVAAVFISSAVWAQESHHSIEPDVFARLSYDSSIASGNDTIRHVCLAVSEDGDYRIERRLQNGLRQRLHGKIPQHQFQQLKQSLDSPAFHALFGNHGGLIRQDSENFLAEFPLPFGHRGQDDSQRLQWLNADGESPFPKPIANVVKWLKNFEPKDGRAFDYAKFPDVCPSRGLRLLQPSVATNSHP